MRIFSIISTVLISIFGNISPVLSWVFKDKSFREIKMDSKISEVEAEYQKALNDIRKGDKKHVRISLKNGDTLVVKSMK